MFVFVKYNGKYEEGVLEAKKYGYNIITTFELTLNNKQQIKDQLIEISSKKNEIKSNYNAIIVTALNIDNSSVSIINSLKKDFDLVIGVGGLNKTNRFFIEDTKVDFLLDPQNSKFKPKIDFIHHFNSGLNQVLCNIAKEKEIGIIFSLNFLLANEKVAQKEIGRINQNMLFLRKYKIPLHINYIIENKFQIKSKIQILSIFSLFNVSTIQKSKNFNVLELKIEKNQKIKLKEFIIDGINEI